MNFIITDNSNAENTISTKIDIFFRNFSISKLMKKSNFYKKGGIQCSEETVYKIMDAFILVLPEIWKQKLKLSA